MALTDVELHPTTGEKAVYAAARRSTLEELAFGARLVGVLSRSEFRLKYAGSLLGYVWSLAKPITYFTVLWVVFGSLFKSGIERYPLYLLIGIVLNTFLIDAVSATLPSIVSKGPTIRRIAFPPVLVPVATTFAAAMTFAANCLVVGIFLGVAGVQAGPDWLLLLPLLLELYVFVSAVALIAATLYVRFRDVGQIWEVASALLFFVAPIMYPLSILPTWARRIVELNPFVQVLEDVRSIILGSGADGVPAATVANQLLPLLIVAVIVAVAVRLYRREAPRFAERA
jgi:ABC-2 type transport system permease protein